MLYSVVNDNIFCTKVVKLVANVYNLSEVFRCGELEAILLFCDVDVKQRDVSSLFFLRCESET